MFWVSNVCFFFKNMNIYDEENGTGKSCTYLIILGKHVNNLSDILRRFRLRLL